MFLGGHRECAIDLNILEKDILQFKQNNFSDLKKGMQTLHKTK